MASFARLRLISWPVIAPIYLFQTPGLRAFSTIGFFCALFLAAMACAMFMGYPASLQP
jgi:hypothetical protein